LYVLQRLFMLSYCVYLGFFSSIICFVILREEGIDRCRGRKKSLGKTSEWALFDS